MKKQITEEQLASAAPDLLEFCEALYAAITRAGAAKHSFQPALEIVLAKAGSRLVK